MPFCIDFPQFLTMYGSQFSSIESAAEENLLVLSNIKSDLWGRQDETRRVLCVYFSCVILTRQHGTQSMWQFDILLGCQSVSQSVSQFVFRLFVLSPHLSLILSFAIVCAMKIYKFPSRTLQNNNNNNKILCTPKVLLLFFRSSRHSWRCRCRRCRLCRCCMNGVRTRHHFFEMFFFHTMSFDIS